MNLLVVVDMQNDFIDGSLGSGQAQKIIGPAADRIEEFDGEVVYTMDTHGVNYMETQEGRGLPVLHCVEGTEGWKLNARVKEALDKRNAKYFIKNAYGSVALAEYIRERAPKNVTIIGLCTDVCVISNAMLIKSFTPELKVFVDAGCCAGVTPERHKNALAAMRACQIETV